MAEIRPEDEHDVDCVREAHGDTELPYTWDDIGCMMTVRQLCDSHEALRAAIVAANKRVEEANVALENERRESAVWQNEYLGRLKQAHADLAAMTERAAQAEDLLGSHRRAGLRLEAERDAALARVAEVEKELDAARRLYCREIAKHGERIYGKGDCCAWNEPRKICLDTWPTEADRLFPPDGR